MGYTGASLSPTTLSRLTKEKRKSGKMTKERDNGKYSLGRARPALLATLPDTLLSIPILIH